jgi:polyisoprenoid-binding protein YceI
MVYRGRAPERIFPCMNITQHETTTTATTTTWVLDPVHTTVGFSVRHLMVTNVRGEFQKVTGRVRYTAGRPEAAEVEAEIRADSISTHEPQRDAHLRSADFFDAQNHPIVAFRSSAVRSVGPGRLEVAGRLTIRGTTRDVTLAVDEVTGEQKDHNGKTRMGASATAKIRRSDFGMTYNKVLEAGGFAVADEIAITIDVSLVKSDAS